MNKEAQDQANKWIRMGQDLLEYLDRVVKQFGPTLPALEMKMDYWEVLGMPRNSKQTDLKTRWLQLMQVYHPDRCGGHGEMAAKINEAYQEICREKGWKA